MTKAAALLAMTVVFALVLGVPPASALVCATTPVSARGEPSQLEWLAKTKARANWRSRVRATAQLGVLYSTPSRAIDANSACVAEKRGTVCTFTATPCRL
jgi:hypothetical protein